MGADKLVGGRVLTQPFSHAANPPAPADPPREWLC
jgi:hypothetical protein